MTSIVIAAHNEAAVIGRCLDSLLAGAAPGELDITVVANGCRDDTAAVAAARSGVRVIDRSEPGKTGALNAGDAAAVGFPRLYLDADIVLTAAGVRELVAALSTADNADSRSIPLAVMPRRRFDLRGASIPVRAFYAINARLPVFRDGLFGRGLIVLAERGRARFDTFPEVVADDLFLDSLFSPAEKRQVETVVTTIAVPRRARDLVRRLARVRSGNASLRRAATDQEIGTIGTNLTVRRSHPLSWLRDVVLPRPWLAPAAVCYVAIIMAAGIAAKRSRGGPQSWGHDQSTRTNAPNHAANSSGDL